MVYKLFNRPGSAGMAVEATFEFAGISYELENIESIADQPTPASFRQINPWGQVPALILPSGDTLTEVSAMLIHLAAAHPDTAIGPSAATPAGARFLRWTIFSSVNIHEAISRRIYSSRFTDNPDHYGDVKSAATTRLQSALTTLEEAIGPGPFLLGNDMCAADIYFAMFISWCEGEFSLPKLQAIESRVRQHDKTGPVWARHNAGS
jgi:glutathione S-transferase